MQLQITWPSALNVKVDAHLTLHNVPDSTLMRQLAAIAVALGNVQSTLLSQHGVIMSAQQDAFTEVQGTLATIGKAVADLKGDVVTVLEQLAGMVIGQISTEQLQALKSQALKLLEQIRGVDASVEAATGIVTPEDGTTTPPPGPLPLAASFADVDSFNGALTGYAGPEAVDLNGVEVRTGTAPALTYFTQEDGTVSTTNPTVGTIPDA